jgi:hypothetical protein
MNGPIVALVALIAAGGIGAAAYVALKPTEEAKFLTVCDDILGKRLKAPSTYRRISATKITNAKAGFNQFMGWDVPGAWKRESEARLSDPTITEIQVVRKEVFDAAEWTRYSTWIEYDAANAYGTPVRGAAEFALIARSEEPMSIGPLSDVRVDGFDHLGWTVHQLWLARQ